MSAYKWTNDDNSEGFLTAGMPELSSFPDTIKSHESLYKFSIENRDLFWQTIARKRLDWMTDFTEVTSGNFNDEDFQLKWFIGGKLNVAGKILLLFFVVVKLKLNKFKVFQSS